jgi:hypothetical protein
MTSPTIGNIPDPEQHGIEGRSVRDIVEHDPGQVSEAWCRKIFRKLLQSLELQYAMQMPHRAITADTVVFHENGEPLLLPSIISDPEPDEAGDLTALARLIHYAITQELVPTGPLHGRALDGYSESLITAVDRCMDPDPDKRPRSFEELRNILGVAAPAPASAPSPAQAATPVPPPAPPPAQAAAPVPPQAQTAAPASAPQPPHEVPAAQPVKASLEAPAPGAKDGSQPARNGHPRGLSRWQRWAMAAGGAAILLAVAAAMRDTGSVDNVALILPKDGGANRPQASGDAPPLLPAAPGATAPLPAAVPSDGATAAQGSAVLPAPPAPGATPPWAAAPPSPAVAAPGTEAASATPTAATAPNSASYKLQIQPWGIVYVDGVDRGVSPPVKHLVLTPGRHTIRVSNPNFNERVLEVDTANGDGRIAVDFSDAAE